ncbi:MAG: PCMD domain-containing protein [Bacteroides sp.]
MKLKHLMTCLFIAMATTSCIQDEAANTEADILTCQVPGIHLTTEPIVQNQEITIIVNKLTDLTHIAPQFTLTPGASINPVSGTDRNFNNATQSLIYTVTAADSQWSKNYIVRIVNSEMTSVYNFEDVSQKEPYYVFAEKQDGVVSMQWASGNSGYAITGMAKNENEYPTLQSPDGKTGKCLKLVTRSTGSFGAGLLRPMRIAAGNLFIGKFDILSALQDALKATHLGLPFYNEPTYLTGYYKYKSGEQYTTADGAVVEGKRDLFDIFALFYETDEKVKYLDGTNNFTSPNLISVAHITGAKETTDNRWAEFHIPFITKPGKAVDQKKLKAGKYNITIVFAASVQGDRFNGSVGSTLMIDEVQLHSK